MQFSPQLVFKHPTTLALYSVQPDAVVAGGDCVSNGSLRWCESDCTIDNCHVPALNLEPRNSGGVAGGNGCGYIDRANFESGPSTVSYLDCKDYPPPSGITGYKTGYLTYSVSDPGGGKAKLAGIKFEDDDGTGRLKGKAGNITWIWIDNLRLSVPGINGGGPSKVWREVAAP
jgi:hypothetical protein